MADKKWPGVAVALAEAAALLTAARERGIIGTQGLGITHLSAAAAWRELAEAAHRMGHDEATTIQDDTTENLG
jgi:hypothetical protein